MITCASFVCFPQGNCPKVSSINDRSDWKVVRKALNVIGFNEDEVEVRTKLVFAFSPKLLREVQKILATGGNVDSFSLCLYDDCKKLLHIVEFSLLTFTTTTFLKQKLS